MYNKETKKSLSQKNKNKHNTSVSLLRALKMRCFLRGLTMVGFHILDGCFLSYTLVFRSINSL